MREWDGLPWWQQAMYLSQMNASRQDPEIGTDLDLEYPFGVPQPEKPVENLAELGVKVVRVQFGEPR